MATFGSQAGVGSAVATAELEDGAVTDAKVSATAAIARSKLDSVAASGANSDITSLSGLTTPLSVAQGGIGAATLGDAGVLVGNGTGAVQATAAGTAGQVLTSNGAGVDPTFQAVSAATVVTLIPKPVCGEAETPGQPASGANTEMWLGQIIVPFKIVVNKISFRTGTTSPTSGTWDLTIYSEDGQTQKIAVTTGTVDTADTIYTTAVAGVTLEAGIYYIGINANGTATADLLTWTNTLKPFSTAAGLTGDVASEPVLVGIITITAGTPPATITPGSITDTASRTLIIRLDN